MMISRFVHHLTNGFRQIHYSSKMKPLQNLSLLPPAAFENFLNSFDTVITDCDGVIYIVENTLPGAVETIKKLEKLNKKICYLSNNSFITFDILCKNLTRYGFDPVPENVANPNMSLVNYLKKINFTGKAFVMGTKNMVEDIKRGGIEVVDRGPAEVEETFAKIGEAIKLPADINAVVMCIDVNLSYIRLYRASVLLRNPEVLFLVGGTDTLIPAGKHFFIGPGNFTKILETFTGRQAISFAKPSKIMAEYITEKFRITDPKRVLFIGDSLDQDIAFAKLNNFQNLLMLSGVTSLEKAQSVEVSKQPDYYVENISVFNDLLEQYLSKK